MRQRSPGSGTGELGWRLRGAAAVLLGLGLLALALPSPAEAYSRIEPAGGDLAAGTTTTGEITVGGELGRATRQTRQDVDWFRVSLSAGQTYTVDLLGSNATGCTLIDPVLQGVHDPDGQLIAGTWRGDGGTGLNSRLTFTPARIGVHYVAAAGAFENDYIGTGTYAVAVTAGSTSDDAALRSTGCGGVPSAPSGVDALAGTGNARVRVLWTASSDTTVTGYEVLRGRKVGDIKSDRKCLHIPSGKGGTERMAPLPDGVIHYARATGKMFEALDHPLSGLPVLRN